MARPKSACPPGETCATWNLPEPPPARNRLQSCGTRLRPVSPPRDSTVYYRGHGAAAEGAAVEGGVATAREGLVHIVGPGQIGAEDGHVAGRARGQRASS